MSAVEPRHDAPLCKCGGPLQPSAYADGMLRPEGNAKFLQPLRCAACGDEIVGDTLQVIQAWSSAMAYEQHLVDEVEIARLQAEAEVQSSEITRLRELLAGQGVLDFVKPTQGGCLLCEEPSFRGDLVGDHPACPECHTPWPS